MGNATKTVTDADFDAAGVLKSQTPKLVDFWAEEVRTIARWSPRARGIAAARGTRDRKTQRGQNPATAAAYGVTSIPTMNVYSGGEVIKQIIGARPRRHYSGAQPVHRLKPFLQ